MGICMHAGEQRKTREDGREEGGEPQPREPAMDARRGRADRLKSTAALGGAIGFRGAWGSPDRNGRFHEGKSYRKKTPVANGGLRRGYGRRERGRGAASAVTFSRRRLRFPRSA